jgi:hypothetical protein
MNTPLYTEGKVLSSYKEVSRTFTYGIYATLPLFIIYQVVTYFIGVVLVKDGQKYRMVSDSDYFLKEIWTFLGIPQTATPLLLIISMMAMLYYERRKLGFIQPQISFFFRTLGESVYFGFILKYATALLAASAIFFLFGTFPPIISPSVPASLPEILQKTGFGFYEEILYRVILLSGLLAFFRVLHIPGMIARIVAVTAVSMIFSGVHFFGPFAYHYDLESFLYLGYLGMFFSAIYLWRGFATVAWSHALFDIFLSF